MLPLGLRILLWMLLLAVERDHEGSAMFLRPSSFSPSSRNSFSHGNFFGNLGSPSTSRGSPSYGVSGYSTGQGSAYPGNAGGYGQSQSQGHVVYPGRRDAGFARPAPGYGNPFAKSSNSNRGSAFQNLFGDDIGKPAGIYDSFGRAKPDNLAIASHSKPKENFGLNKKPDLSNPDQGQYRSHPFSSIRLSPITQVSGVAVQSPNGQSPFNNHDDYRDRNIMFTKNRAQNYRQNDPFERPISKSSFPLPNVNDPITLDLAEDEQNRVNYAKNNNKLPPVRGLTGDSKKERKVGRPGLIQNSPVLPSIGKGEPAGAFGWEKPPSIPELPSVGTGKKNDSSPRLPPIEKPSVSKKGSNGLRLPELPSKQNKNRPGIGNLLRKKQPPSTINNSNITSDKGDSLDQVGTNNEDAGDSSKSIDNFTEGRETNGDASEEDLRNSYEDDSPENQRKQGRYDITVLTDEEITKKSGRLEPDPDIGQTSPTIQAPVDTNTADIPATKSVVERTIEDGRQKVVAKTTYLPTDNVGFILNDENPSPSLKDESNRSEYAASKPGGIIKKNQGIRSGSRNAQGTSSARPEYRTHDIGGVEHNGKITSHNPGNVERIDDDTKENNYNQNRATEDTSDNPRDQGLTNFGDDLGASFDDSNGKFADATENSNSADESNKLNTNGVIEVAPTKSSVVGTDYGLSGRPTIGSGYLTDIFEPGNDVNDVPPSPSSFVYPKNSDVSSDDGFIYSASDESESEGNENKIKDVIFDNTNSTSNYQNPDNELRIGIQEAGDKQTIAKQPGDPTDAVYNGNNDEDIINSPSIVTENEHINLDNLKDYTEKTQDNDKNGASSSSLFSKPGKNAVDENGVPDFSDYNFNLGQENYPFSNENNKHGHDFSINTDPASLNFDVLNAGEGNINVHRSSKAFKPESERILDLNVDSGSNPSSLRTNNLKYINADSGDDVITGDTIAVTNGINDVDGAARSNGGFNSEKDAILVADDDRVPGDSADIDASHTNDDHHTGEFTDYSHYYDPNYDYDYATPTPQTNRGSSGYETQPSTFFKASPFESMFGKSVDQAEKGSFGSLFQNVGQQPSNRGGAKGKGRNLFDPSLGQIIERRPSLDLFGRKKRKK